MTPTDQAYLIYNTVTQDSDGYGIETPVETEILVEKKSVKRSEFYAAMQSGIKVEMILEAWIDDYELTKRVIDNKPVYADKVKFEGYTYDIIRTYSDDGIRIELVCG